MGSGNVNPLNVTVITSLVVAVLLLAIRVYVMQRVQSQRQRENRQETERLKSLVAAYKAMAGSFSPAEPGDKDQLEGGLSDIILFGSVRQVELASTCARDLATGAHVDYQPLIDDLRTTLRDQLGLDPIPSNIIIPASGPAPVRASSGGDRQRGAGGAGRGKGGGAGGGGPSGAGEALGAGTGIDAGHVATDSANGAT